MKYLFKFLICALPGFVLSLTLLTSMVQANESNSVQATDSATVESIKPSTEEGITEDSAEDSETETGTDGETEVPAVTEDEPQTTNDSIEKKEEKSEGKPETTANSDEKKLSIMDLLKSGGVLMIPIGIMSVLVVMVGLERFVGLRRGAVIPHWLMHNVDVQISAKADPRAIYALCRQNRSALSRVIQAALFKAGRPMAEVQEAIEQAKENEANRLYSRVRLLVLAASVTPLIGLLGTVVGMIQAFMATASTIGIHKAEMLSEGIYLALITTCAGLTVAIPAAILAHWYEGKIQRLFYRMDQQLINFIAFMESLEGKVRLTPASYKAYVKQKSGK